jgi:hypothetical protein
MLTRSPAVLGSLCLIGLCGCYEGDRSSPSIPAAPAAPATGTEQPDDRDWDDVASPFRGRLLEIARTYKGYGNVDNHLRWAPTDCLIPPDVLHYSASKDKATHGGKIYALFAQPCAKGSYLPARGGAAPVGQVVVKEAWRSEEVTQWVSELGHVQKDGRRYRAGRQAELFIMYKMDPETPDTDQGWVYGTVSSDGKRVLSAGRVESCMNCHRDAPHDRLFGVSKP